MRFRMVDRILSWQPGRRICGVKAVSFEEYCLKAPFREPERLPETLLLECFYQLGNWLVVLSSGFTQMGMVVRTQQATFDAPPGPGESVTMEITVRRRRTDGILFDGLGRAGGRLVAAGKGCLAVPVPLSDYCDPDDVRTVFSEIYRPREPAP
jgi:3-hydroxyacyl-[acyl-carrier-protein] dehydratase